MTSTNPERRGWPTWAVVSAFWLATSLLYAAQITVMSTMPGENFRLAVLLAWQVPFWMLWALLAPVVLWLGDRFPLDGRRWTGSLPIHIVSLLVVACVHSAVAVTISKRLDTSSAESFWMAYRGFVVSRLHFELMIYAATLAVGYGLEYRRRLRERELSASRLETQLANARLDALRMQLNPHFLFNTLHTVAALVRGRRHDEAVTMIAGLSDLLRRTLDGHAVQETSLADELTFVERYLDIQRVRFGDRLRVELRIDPATRDARVPTLLLQPLVENALRHGLAPRAAAGRLTIAATRDNGRLRVEVQDDGVGWRGASDARATEPDLIDVEADALVEAEPAAGVGLSNTRSRLQHLYGDAARLDLADAPGGGACVRVEMPYREAVS